MKKLNLIIFSLLFVSIQSHGQLQNVVQGNVTPGFYSLSNYVLNPSCLSNKNNITDASSILTRITSSGLVNGIACQIDSTATSQVVKFATRSFDGSLKNQSCEAQIVYNGDASLYQFYVEQGVSNTVVSTTLTLTNTAGDSKTASVSFPCGDGTNATRLVVASTGNGAVIKTALAYVGLSTSSASSSSNQSYELSNVGLSSSVAANALTVALRQFDGSSSCSTGTAACKIGFRSSTLTSGAYNQRSVTSALSLTVPSGASLGHVSAVSEYVYVYALDNAGTVELAVSGSLVDAGVLISTTAISAGSTSRTTVYSTTARTSVPFRLLGRFKSTQTTAGTWASAMSEISLGGVDVFLSNQVISAGSSPIRIEYVGVDANCTAGPCTIARQSGSWVNSIGFNNTGDYTININAGTFSSAPTCWGNSGANVASMMLISTVTTTSVRVLHFNGGGSAVNNNFYVTCVGPR